MQTLLKIAFRQTAFLTLTFAGMLLHYPGSAQTVPQPMIGQTAPSSAGADYTIREGDMIQMSVFNEPELTVSGKVRKDGTVQFPLVGSLRIAGLSQLSASRLVEQAYREDYLVNPEVSLFVSQFTPQRLTVLGQVQRPGSLELTPDKKLTILQVLGMAGGPTRIASLKRVTVKRSVGGRQQSIKVDVENMIKDGRESIFFVQEDDVITVPESLF